MSSDNEDKYSNYTPLHAKEHGRLQANHQDLEKGKEGFLYRFQREHGLAKILISDF